MTQRSAADYLMRAVLDDAFRELTLADPDRAMADYDLSEDEKSILRSRDDRLLGLLGGSMAAENANAEHPASTEITDSRTPSRPTLPAVELLLRLTPHTEPSTDSAQQVSYAASLHPWPLPTTVERDEGEPSTDSESSPNGASSEMTWLLRLTPTVIQSEEAGLRVSYSAAMHPIDLTAAQAPVASRESVPPTLRSPWKHDVESSAVKTAAHEVLASPKDKRYDKLLALIDVMQSGDDRG